MNHDEEPKMKTLNHSPGTLRRFPGPEATELFLLCRPDPLETGDAILQTRSAYGALQDILASEGGSLDHVVEETVFFRDIREDLPAFLEERRRSLGELIGSRFYSPASTFIEQPPLDERLRLEVATSAVVPRHQASTFAWNVPSAPACECRDCALQHARAYLLGDEEHLRAGNICGARGGAFDEASSMFAGAEAILEREGMSFRNVVRTWIYLRDMERDYGELNRARRAFFQARGLALRPASTGIRGAPFPEEHNFSMGFLAVKAPGPIDVAVMTTPTLNEAWTYGSDFSRGLKVVEGNRTALYVSGTASVDEEGRTAHPGDLEGQVDRMLRNVSTLLAEQGASFADVVSGVTYLKRQADARRLRWILRNRGLDAFPHVLVKAEVCRPDLLCEMEAIALLPPGPGR